MQPDFEDIHGMCCWSKIRVKTQHEDLKFLFTVSKQSTTLHEESSTSLVKIFLRSALLTVEMEVKYCRWSRQVPSLFIKEMCDENNACAWCVWHSLTQHSIIHCSECSLCEQGSVKSLVSSVQTGLWTSRNCAINSPGYWVSNECLQLHTCQEHTLKVPQLGEIKTLFCVCVCASTAQGKKNLAL